MPVSALKIGAHMKEGWRCQVGDVADIADQIRVDHVESLAGDRYDFWFTPSLLSCHRQVNALATKMLYQASGFTAGQVPLMRGAVVVTARDTDGQLASLDSEEMHELVESAYAPGLWTWTLEWRLARAVRRERRRLRSEREQLNRLQRFAY